MTQITVQVSDQVAARIQSWGLWQPTILELSLARFKTKAAAGAQEIVDFLVKNPAPREVREFSLSDKLQRRVSRLLLLNSEGRADESVQRELAEWDTLYHISFMLTVQALELLKRPS